MPINRETHHIDAAGRIPGRLAAEIAVLLRGKNKPDFMPNKDIGDFVLVENVGKMKIAEKKLAQKKYYRHSGYPGGLKETPLKEVFSNNPEEVLRKAVEGMLPKNKLRKEQIKRIIFK